MKKIKSELLFADQTHNAADTLSDSEMFTFPCGDGCLWGQVMRPDGGFGEGRPCVIFLHGFPGGNRNDDFAHALCRIGCVVLVLLMVIFGVYGIGFDATQFIYNQF